MKKILITLLTLITVGCGSIVDGGTKLGYNSGYTSEGLIVKNGNKYSGTVDVVKRTALGASTDDIIASYKVKDGFMIKEFDKPNVVSGKLKYDVNDKLHHGTITLENVMYGEVEGSWRLNPYKLSTVLQHNSFFGKPSTNILDGSVYVNKAKVNTFLDNEYKSTIVVKNHHIKEYNLFFKDKLCLEYKAGNLNDDGSFEVEIIVYNHDGGDGEYIEYTELRKLDVYNAKKIVISGIAKYPEFSGSNFWGPWSRTDHNMVLLDPTTNYEVSGGFGKTYYDDSMYIYDPRTKGIKENALAFDNPKAFNEILNKLFITDTKERFSNIINR